jgi:hypothetical protein
LNEVSERGFCLGWARKLALLESFLHGREKSPDRSSAGGSFAGAQLLGEVVRKELAIS